MALDSSLPDLRSAAPSGPAKGRHLLLTTVAFAASLALLASCSSGKGKAKATATSSAAAAGATFSPMSNPSTQPDAGSPGGSVSGTPSTAPPVTTIDGTVLPSDPVAYATAVFDAWKDADRAKASTFAKGTAVSSLFAKSYKADDGWTGPNCRGTNGSSYCTWTSAIGRLIIRVASQDIGKEQAAVEAKFA